MQLRTLTLPFLLAAALGSAQAEVTSVPGHSAASKVAPTIQKAAHDSADAEQIGKDLAHDAKEVAHAVHTSGEIEHEIAHASGAPSPPTPEKEFKEMGHEMKKGWHKFKKLFH